MIACVNTTGSTDIADYTYKMFQQWKIGDKDKRNGVLVLLAIDDRDYYALQGKGLDNLLSSGTLKLMLDQYLEPAFSAGDYDAGAVSIFDALVAFLSEIYSVSVNVPAAAPEETTNVVSTQSVDQWILEAFTDHSVSVSAFDPVGTASSFFHNFPLYHFFSGLIKEISFSKIIIIIVVIILISSLIKGRRH